MAIKDVSVAGEDVLSKIPHLSREKTFANLAFFWRFSKVFSVKIYSQAIRYHTSGRGVVHWVAGNSRKFSPVKETYCTV